MNIKLEGREVENGGGSERRGVGNSCVLLRGSLGRPVPTSMDQSRQSPTRQRTLDQRGHSINFITSTIIV